MQDEVPGMDGLAIGHLFPVAPATARRAGASVESGTQYVVPVLFRAASVFESPERAREWLETELPALGGRRPVDLCDTAAGRRLVQDAIRRIEYGEFS